MRKVNYILLALFIIVCIFYYQDPYAMEESRILIAPNLKNILGVIT